MLKAKFSKEEVYFEGDSLKEDLIFADVKTITVKPLGNKDLSPLSWHNLIRKTVEPIKEHKILNDARTWGLGFTKLSEVESILKSQRTKYSREEVSIEEFKNTSAYQVALEQVKDMFGHTFLDGSKMYDYQMESAAIMRARKRILLSLDMGLGKTRTTLVSLASDPSNKKILIVTMSRNLGDWLKEINTVGLGSDYVLIESRSDMKSTKRIHLVSYEAWAKEAIHFINKVEAHECPNCKRQFRWNTQLQYCGYCKEGFPSEEQYTPKDLPKDCPCCASAWKHGKLFCNCGFTVVKSRKKPLYKFFNRSYDAAAIDEAHYIKNGTTKRSRAIRAIKTKYRIALTGTPAENGADDLFWPLTWVSGDSHHFADPISGGRFDAFGKKGEDNFRGYFGGSGNRALMDANRVDSRASNAKVLWDLLDKFMIRKKKTDQDVVNEISIPKPVHRRIHLNLDLAERKLYDKRLEEFRDWYAEQQFRKESAKKSGGSYHVSTIEVCSWLDKLRKIASCPWVPNDYEHNIGGEPVKLRTVKDKMMEYASQNKKLLIFTAHKDTAQQLGDILDSVVPGKRAAYIHGGVSMKFRYKLMADFQDPKHPLTVLVMTMRTGAESYTLTEAKGVILYDLEYNAKKIEQCYSRAVRLGQKDQVEVTWLIGVDTIDANMHALVLSKQAGVDLAIDRNEMDMDQISKEFETDGSVDVQPGIDYLAFASELLSRGNKRQDYVS